MKKLYWLLITVSAILYALPFLFSKSLWWLIFAFPIPLLYITRTEDLTFIHGFIWAAILITLQLSGCIVILIALSHDAWWLGVILSIGIIVYQALSVALLFWATAQISHLIAMTSPLTRLCIWTATLMLFIIWIDEYSLLIFGTQEGYPLMHPLLPLAQQPQLLWLLPIVGTYILTALFLLVSVSCVLLLWYTNGTTLILCIIAIMPWLLSWCYAPADNHYTPHWYTVIKSLPLMTHATTAHPDVIIHTVRNELTKIITHYPATEIVIMPESAFNISNFAQLPDLLQLWSKQYVGKSIHLICGASRKHESTYYNTAYWIYDGVLQGCHDKRHTMLISEKLTAWMNNDLMRQVYFNHGPSVATSHSNRTQFSITDDRAYVPYICSELFCNRLPDDNYKDIPIIAIINDSRFITYMQDLLLVSARYKAIQWQRDIVYVSYTQSVFIDKHGNVREINE